MNGVSFLCALISGLDQVECEELVLRACVARAVPRELWRQDVADEIKRQKVADPDLALTDYLCGSYYERNVAGALRWRFLTFWTFPERLWWATEGRHGSEPAACRLVNLTAEVLRAGRKLPWVVCAGVPKTPWRERIGVPR